MFNFICCLFFNISSKVLLDALFCWEEGGLFLISSFSVNTQALLIVVLLRTCVGNCSNSKGNYPLQVLINGNIRPVWKHCFQYNLLMPFILPQGYPSYLSRSTLLSRFSYFLINSTASESSQLEAYFDSFFNENQLFWP